MIFTKVALQVKEGSSRDPSDEEKRNFGNAVRRVVADTAGFDSSARHVGFCWLGPVIVSGLDDVVVSVEFFYSRDERLKPDTTAHKAVVNNLLVLIKDSGLFRPGDVVRAYAKVYEDVEYAIEVVP